MIDSERVSSHGGAVAFDAVYAEHLGFVWRGLRALGVPPSALDDGAQDVFLAVHRRLSSFGGGPALRAWLLAIVRNVASNHRRARRRKDARHDPLDVEPTHPGPGPLERVEREEAARFTRDFLAQLGAGQRDVFVLGVIEEMSMPEVAAALSIPVNTAYTRLRRARAAFQRALHDRFGHAGEA